MILAKISFKLLFVVTLLDITKALVLPQLSLLLWIAVLMGVDFITGVLKAKLLKETITSQRARDTIIKFLQYFGCIGITIVIINQVGQSDQVTQAMNWAKDGVCILIIYIECLSILENLYGMDKTSPLSRWIFGPLYMLLSLAIKNNPFKRAADEAKEQDDRNQYLHNSDDKKQDGRDTQNRTQ